jgi:hypothetical protein
MKFMIPGAVALTVVTLSTAVTACAEPAPAPAATPAAAKVTGRAAAKWGMTPAEVVKAVGGSAKLSKGTGGAANGGTEVVSAEVIEGLTRTLEFQFDYNTKKLAAYHVLFPGGLQPCETMRKQLDGRYGKPFYTSGGPADGWINSVWYDAKLPGQVELFSQGEGADATCRLTFMDEMAANARGADGKTRHEGNPTPRPEYKPYRPAS